MPDSDEAAAGDERLKAALWYSLGKTVDAISIDSNINAAPTFIGGLTEMVAAKIALASTDMEAFAKHAGRSTVNSKDVILLARHNEALQEILQHEAETVRKRDKSAAR
ncbi:hypothetical protein AC578_9230 [Pseudocercospora eumusae]|uniref:Centromere protein S n=1 Tax=Pseudocercospora eumusae TaxID=321146 RepID=A0A139HN94_9PEZI|nr:hypothetical protein AC578_9230 [Pseudocercospora eumusae]